MRRAGEFLRILSLVPCVLARLELISIYRENKYINCHPFFVRFTDYELSSNRVKERRRTSIA
jgi:hypothetical protein